MMVRLEKRPTPSRKWAYLTPPIAVIATMIAGGILFAFLGKDPVVAIRTIFWDPVLANSRSTIAGNFWSKPAH